MVVVFGMTPPPPLKTTRAVVIVFDRYDGVPPAASLSYVKLAIKLCSNLLKLHAKHRNEIARSNLGRTAKPVTDVQHPICSPQRHGR